MEELGIIMPFWTLFSNFIIPRFLLFLVAWQASFMLRATSE